MSARRSAGPGLATLAALSLAIAPGAPRAAEYRETIASARSLEAVSPGAAEQLLRGQVREHPGKEAALLLVELGDLALRQENPKEARNWFRDAAQQAPTLETPVRRLIDLGVSGLPRSARDLLADLANARVQHPTVALRGYRDLMRGLVPFRADSGGAGSPETVDALANEALVEIVRLLAGSTGRLDIEAVGVDSAWAPVPWAELRGALDITATVPPNGFWMSSSVRRNVLARTKLAQGRRALALGRADLAELHFEAGLRLAPGYPEYMYGPLHGADMARLDLCTDLLGMWAGRPDVGPDSPRFRALIDEIFEGKGMAYQANDLGSIQRHHEVLGFAYAARGIWTSTEYARNATFQLRNVLNVAERRRGDVGYQPLPLVKAALAAGLERNGPNRESLAMRLEAARAYLDVDQLDSARAELGRVRVFSHASGTSLPATWAPTNRVLVDRVRVRRLGAPGAAVDTTYESIARRWSDRPDGGLPSDFVDRQRFKILSDLLAIEVPADRRQVVTLAMAGGFERNPTPTLVGVGDLIRLERVQSKALSSVGVAPARAEIQNSKAASRSGVPLGSTAGRAGSRVVTSAYLGEALRLSALQDSDSTLRRTGSRVVLRGDSVVVEASGASEVERRKIQQDVQRVTPRNVRVVKR